MEQRPENYDEESEENDFDDDTPNGTSVGAALRMALEAMFIKGDGKVIFNMRRSYDPTVRKVGWIITLIIVAFFCIILWCLFS